MSSHAVSSSAVHLANRGCLGVNDAPWGRGAVGKWLKETGKAEKGKGKEMRQGGGGDGFAPSSSLSELETCIYSIFKMGMRVECRLGQ